MKLPFDKIFQKRVENKQNWVFWEFHKLNHCIYYSDNCFIHNSFLLVLFGLCEKVIIGKLC